ncbi:MAG: recombination mediator RecR [Candidatus Methylacidiphilales bacterium]
MTEYPDSVRRLMAVLKELPSIGSRSAERMALQLLRTGSSLPEALAAALLEVSSRIGPCPECGHLAEDGGLCQICSDPRRDRTRICVVDSPSDVITIERSSSYHGLYHVLGGTLSPLDGIGPDELNLARLVPRLDRPGDAKVTEVILALGTDVRGETTALYISQLLSQNEGLTITRPATGIAVGGSLEFADAPTLAHAFLERKAVR